MDRYQILKHPESEPIYAPVPDKSKPLSEEAKEELISTYLRTASGRQSLARSMANPLRSRMDYESVARRAFQVQPLPQGVLPIYDRSITFPESGDSSLHSIDQLEDVITTKQQNFIPPIVQFSYTSQIPLSQLRERRFGLINRFQDLAVQDLKTLELNSTVKILEAATSERKLIAPKAEYQSSSITQIYNKSFETMGLVVASILMNVRDYIPLRRFATEALGNRPPLFDGADLWGARIIVTRGIPEGNIYFLAEPRYAGRLSIQEDVQVFPADDPRALTIGWFVSERVGFCCNSRGVFKLEVSKE